MALAQKPSEFRLDPGKGLLKGRTALQTNARHGMTDGDMQKCEEWAWMNLISIFAGPFDTSGWEAAPPQPIPQLWELIASASYLRFIMGQFAVDKGGNDLPTTWGREADAIIRGLIPGKAEKGEHRRYLIKQDGTIQYPRKDYTDGIYVIASAITFFPEYDTDKSHGETTTSSFERYFKDRNIED